MPRVWSGSTGTAVGFKSPESEGPWSLRVGLVGREEEGGDSPARERKIPRQPRLFLGRRDSARLTRTSHSENQRP